MSDITMCTGYSVSMACPRKDVCYRYRAPVNPLNQSFMNAPLTEDGGCSMFVPVDTHANAAFYFTPQTDLE